LPVRKSKKASHIIKRFSISADAVLDHKTNMKEVDKSMADIIPTLLLKSRRPIIKVNKTTPIPESALGILDDSSVTTPLNEKGNIIQ